jgi:DNA-binding CsgD family transcriptional regulator
LLLAVADREKPQSIRFGRRWVDGRRPVAPTMLSLRRLSKWLDQRARRIAGAIILDASSEAWAARIRLSRRERELVNLLTQDADRANAARRMKVAPSTVRTMLQRIKGKGTKM